MAMRRDEWIAKWIEYRFQERSVWLQSELISRAWADHIDLLAYYDSPAVQAVGIKGMVREIYPTCFAQCFVIAGQTEPEGANA